MSNTPRGDQSTVTMKNFEPAQQNPQNPEATIAFKL
jgi:hypothetical protein